MHRCHCLIKFTVVRFNCRNIYTLTSLDDESTRGEDFHIITVQGLFHFVWNRKKYIVHIPLELSLFLFLFRDGIE